MRLITADSVAPSPWRNGGGQTRELYADAEAHTLGSAWRVRISLADITQDGPFSAFPGVQRHFAVVSGAGVVLTVAGRPHTLTPGSHPLTFDGALAPDCRLVNGPTRDLNLMLQGGASGELTTAMLGTPWHSPYPWRAAFTTEPALLQLPSGEALPLPAACLIVGLPAGPVRLAASGAAPMWWIGVRAP